MHGVTRDRSGPLPRFCRPCINVLSVVVIAHEVFAHRTSCGDVRQCHDAKTGIISGTFQNDAKVVNSLFGETWRIAGFEQTNCQLGFERCLISNGCTARGHTSGRFVHPPCL